jgi:hypothetical protein
MGWDDWGCERQTESLPNFDLTGATEKRECAPLGDVHVTLGPCHLGLAPPATLSHYQIIVLQLFMTALHTFAIFGYLPNATCV